MRDLSILLCVSALAACSRGVERSTAPREEIHSTLPADLLARQRASDEQVLRSLRDAGADLSKPHSIEYHFICPNRTAAAPVIEWGRASGYRPSRVSDGEYKGRAYVYFDLVRNTVPTIENLTPQTIAMLEAARRFAVEFDGWACDVVR